MTDPVAGWQDYEWPQEPTPEPVNDPAQHGIPRHRRLELRRHLAAEDMTRAKPARKYGVDRSTITHFARRHKMRIDGIRTHLDDEFAGLWIAAEHDRLAALMADYELGAVQVPRARNPAGRCRRTPGMADHPGVVERAVLTEAHHVLAPRYAAQVPMQRSDGRPVPLPDGGPLGPDPRDAR